MLRLSAKSSRAHLRHDGWTSTSTTTATAAISCLTLRFISSSRTADSVRIGHVEMATGTATGTTTTDTQHLVPSKYLPSNPSPTFLRHLQWMMAKDALGQDMLLIGPPGAGSSYRRRLVLSYAELTQKPVEILTLTSDLTESDLKQRRELVETSQGQTAIEFVDQAPVRAAKHGRLLLLDGLHRAERNVLPTLNNLLENREMHLEDGSFLISPQRFQEIGKGTRATDIESSSSSASSNFLVPVHSDFRVIALGVPTPPYPGRNLDPPIRSRFQIRRVDNPATAEVYQDLAAEAGEEETAKFCATLAGAMQDAKPSFPSTSLNSILDTISLFPKQNRQDILLRAYPLAIEDEQVQTIFGVSNEESKQGFWTAVRTLDASSHEHDDFVYPIERVARISDSDPYLAEVSFGDPPNDSSYLGSTPVSVTVPCGSREVNRTSLDFVQTVGAWSTLSAMAQEHAVGRDIILISPKGEGKNATAQQFASLLGYDTNLFAMYSEMTSQDLLLRRTTDQATGQSQWEESPLLKAARMGEMCILDGVEKLRPDVLSSLQSLLMDREVALPDGRRVLRQDRVADESKDDNMIRVHPSFRIVALASLKKDIGTRWITSDLMSMFSTILLPSPTEECLRAILGSNNPNCPASVVDSILKLKANLTESVAEDCGVAPLSTRNLIRAVRRVGTPSCDAHSILSSILLADLLPPSQRALLESVLCKSRITPTASSGKGKEEKKSISIDGGMATIGSVEMRRGETTRPEMVPSPKNFFDIPCHVNAIQDLVEDYQNGERALLLLGNQGVGKNMIIDRICEIANWEREYIQLHRDSTIGQLTLTPTLENGRIVWKDSPLVRAARDGCALVIDEADKAPVEVVSVLKGLVEDGELLLADGRRISKQEDGPGFIKIHPNFSLWVLANRPGFPFLGNDFFREIGDCFSTRVIQNPDLQSEISLLQSYAPSIDPSTLRSLAASFSELRHLSDNGEITYPYSTREAVAVVRHLVRYPSDNIVTALHNVLDFDSYDDAIYSTLGRVFQRHGIPVTDYPTWREALQRTALDAEGGNLRVEFFSRNGPDGESLNPPENSSPKQGKWDENNEAHIGGNQWAGGTGGSDTAGLGGRGGPYRLDRGHKVHQVSEKAKSEVSEDAAKAARAIAKKSLVDRLKEIDMSKTEWTMYERFRTPITEDIARLRGILDSVVSRSSERGWLKRQSYGEIDDTKLIDGVTGDKYIYKRRGTVEEAPSHKKKRLRFVMDCSGSMYRFNGYDERLTRCLEAALLVMESFDGFESRFDYSIVGHSGDSSCIRLVHFGQPPRNENERMRVLQEMLAHSQYCRSGDFTLEAMGKAIVDVASHGNGYGEERDDCVVIGVSDANLARYGASNIFKIFPTLLVRVLLTLLIHPSRYRT
jgi:MoxR-like ATPase